MYNLPLIIEKSNRDGLVWGRVTFKGESMVTNAGSEADLEKKMKDLVSHYYKLTKKEISFNISYHLSALFEHKHFLNISAIAKEAGINPNLMRQYVSGAKSPSKARLKQIEDVINAIGRQLADINLAT